MLALVNLVVLAGSWGFNVYYRDTLGGDWAAGGWIKNLYCQFHLAAENVLATWYSSTLLLGTSIACLLCAWVDQRRAARFDWLSLGWLAFAGVFLLLSADEVGSVHERIGMMPSMDLFGAGELGWSRILAVPIMLVAGFMAVFGLLRVRRSPWAFGLLLLAAGLFVINPLLERVQMSLLENYEGARTQFEHDLSLHLEEGAELFGALCFLAMACRYLIDATRDATQLVIPRATLAWTLGSLLVAMLASWAIAQHIGFSNIEADDGRVENWYPNALAILSALGAGLIRHRWSAAYLWLTAAYYGIYGKGWVSLIEASVVKPHLLVALVQFLGAVALSANLLRARRARRTILLHLSWLGLLAIGLTTGWPELVDLFEVLAFAVLLSLILTRLSDDGATFEARAA